MVADYNERIKDDHDNTYSPRNAVRDAIMQAMAPLVIEGMGLLTDAVRELREQLKDDSIQRRDCAPLRRQLELKRLQAELEDFDIERAEEKAERENREAERAHAELERENRREAIAENRLEREARLNRMSGDDDDVNGYDADSSSFL